MGPLYAWLPATLALVALLSTCDAPPPTGPASGLLTEATQETVQLLQGTWVREYTAQGVQVRRVLTLDPAGAFQETVRLVDAGGRVSHQQHAGSWLYDGTNLKRKYTRMNGEPPSRLNVPFLTLQVAFETRNEFVGIDHVHGHQMRYRRAAEAPAP